MRAGRNGIERQPLACRVDNIDLRMQVFLVFDDDRAHQAGGLVELLLNRNAFDQVVEMDDAGHLRQHRHVVRIPLHEYVALLDLLAVGHGNLRADDHRVTLEFASLSRANQYLAGLIEHDPVTAAALDCADILIMHHAVIFRLDLRLFEHLARRTADMECPHGQLRARLADGLGRDDADRFAQLGQLARGKVASVTHHAHAAPRLTGQYRPDLYGLDTELDHRVGSYLVNLSVCLNQLLLADRVKNIFGGDASDDALVQLDYFVLAFVDRLHPNTVYSTAILFEDDDVLRHIHEFARHVARVGSLERRIGQSFAGAVRRDEVFQHAQAFTEVR